MGAFVLRFRRDGAVVGQHRLDTNDPESARHVAVIVAQACSDACDSVELWEGGYRIDAVMGSAEIVNARTQRQVVETEEALCNSGWAVARSEQLLARLRELKEQP